MGHATHCLASLCFMVEEFEKDSTAIKILFPLQSLFCSRQFLKWAIWISHYLALLILYFPRKQQWPKG